MGHCNNNIIKILKKYYINLKYYFNKIKLFKEFKPEITLICTPNNCHISDSLLAANYDSNIFVEKPLSNNLRNLDKRIIINRIFFVILILSYTFLSFS